MALQRVTETIVASTFYRSLTRHGRLLKWIGAALGVLAFAVAAFFVYRARFPPPGTFEPSFERAWRTSQLALADHEAVLKLQLVRARLAEQGARGELLALVDSIAEKTRLGHEAAESPVTWAQLGPLFDRLAVQAGNGDAAAAKTAEELIRLLEGRAP